MLPLPNRYIEIGLWKQVIQVNQQVCRRMDQLEKIQEHFAGNVEVYITLRSRSNVLLRSKHDDQVKDGAAWKINFSHHFSVRRYQEQFLSHKSSYL